MISIANCHVALKRSRTNQDFIIRRSMWISWVKSLSWSSLVWFRKHDRGGNYSCSDTSCHARLCIILWRPVSNESWIMHSKKLPGQPLVFMESVQCKPVWLSRLSESFKNGGLVTRLWSVLIYTWHSNVTVVGRLTIKWVFGLFGVGAVLTNVGNKGLKINIEFFFYCSSHWFWISIVRRESVLITYRS